MKREYAVFPLLLVLLACAVAAAAGVPPVINYQGRLTQPSGAPVADGTYSMLFSIYDVATGGTPLWSETNPAVTVKGGLFATMLGSVVNIPANIFDSPTRYFAVKVGSDPEMTPRQQVASSAFAFRAAVAGTVDDGAITASKLAAGVAIPAGTIVMWSGAVGSVPTGWTLCNGSNGAPDLRDKFIVGAGSTYAVGVTGGSTTATVPGHYHSKGSLVNSTYTPGSIDMLAWCNGCGDRTAPGGSDFHGGQNVSHTHVISGVVGNTGSAYNGDNNISIASLPPYYALCYIMKLAY